jgi:hypothetical protein
LTSAEISHGVFLPLPWREAGKIYRRVCLLRSQGRHADAQLVLDADFAGALAVAREGAATEQEADAQCHAMVAAEEERVADAVAMVELLAPMLRDRLPPRTATLASPGRSRIPGGLVPIGEPSVADFIEQMLEQERGTHPTDRLSHSDP